MRASWVQGAQAVSGDRPEETQSQGARTLEDASGKCSGPKPGRGGRSQGAYDATDEAPNKQGGPAMGGAVMPRGGRHPPGTDGAVTP